MKKAKIIILLLFLLTKNDIQAQFTYGTTGLLNMPTADMQKDKTFMLGAGFLEKHATPVRWTYDTYNYYLNITFFPWLEVAYTCTLHKAMKNDPVYGEGYWVPSTYGKFINQDRNFSVRLRIWKEGWWKSWTPQLVLGGNDVTTRPFDDSANFGSTSGNGNGFYSRYYLAATKHFIYHGGWGLHLAYLYNKRTDYHFNGLAFGANYQFNLSKTSFINKVLNRINLMAEYDSKSVNIGASYTCWNDYINAVIELNRCKYPSIGIYFKVHLK